MALRFLDLHDLNEGDKDNLMTILNSDIKTVKLPWNTSDNNNSDNNSVAMTEVQNVEQHSWYNVVPSTYSGQIMTQMCNDWQAQMYNVPANGHVPFMSGMAYPHPGYDLGTEIQDVSYGRENGHRNGRHRGGRRDNYNRTLNPANEMQSKYMGEQAQFHSQIPIVYYTYTDQHPISTQQPQVAPSGQIYYPSMYPSQISISHPHPSAHAIPSSPPHATYPEHHQPLSIPPHNTFVQQLQPVPSQQEQPVEQRTVESRSEPVQNTRTSDESACRQVNDSSSGSAQASIVKVTNTVTVNNSTRRESTIENAKENTAIRKTVTNDEKKKASSDARVQHSVVRNTSETCNGMEKHELCVEVDQNICKKIKDENAPNDKTTAVNDSPKLVHGAGESKAQVEDAAPSKNVQDKTVSDMPNGSSPVTPNASSPVSACETPKPKRSYASLLKKNCSEAPSSCKTAACASENTTIHQNGSPEQKQPTSVDTTPEKQNGLPSTLNGVLQNYYDPNTFRIGEFLSSYRMDKHTVSLIPRGLTNRSNYCYINSILQALLACPPFYNLLMAMPVPKNWRNALTPLLDNMIKFVREFVPMTEAARLPRKDRANKRGDDAVVDIHSGVAFEPSYVYTMLKYTSAASVFSQDGQQDAEEFLSCLLNGINDEMLELMRLVNNEGAENNVSNDRNDRNNHNDHNEEEWQVMGPKNKGAATRSTELERTPLSDIFRGQLRSRISRAGEQPTENIQPFFTLQLDVHKAESVRSAFELLVGKDQLEGMRCSKTRKQIEAWKQVTLEELPVVLILHLKWFVYKFDRYSNGCSKILKSMEFPVDLKIDGKCLSPNTMKKLSPRQKQYKLFAVTYHDGKETTKGHYVTDAFHVGYGSWIRYDDSSVKCVSESNVLKPVSPRVPYLLYYRRCDTIGNNQSNGPRIGA
ncbi:Ubiquitin carboxyl-terminal hydrolase [Ooceraea biroi]|nr:Ubiquitin carboxyl-terminal hydrolase [Ooceraea biroi]